MVNIRFKPSAGPGCQVVAATIPLLTLLTIFLIQVEDQSHKWPYAPADFDDDVYYQKLAEGEATVIPMKFMVITFLAVCQLWAFLAVYVSVFVPRRHKLVERYLTEGRVTVGDVIYQPGSLCCCPTYTHYGQIVYPHPNYGAYPCHIRRQVPVHERYTRERIAVLVLPDLPQSGQPKADMEIDRETFTRNEHRLRFLSVVSWCWVVFAAGAPSYILYVMGTAEDDQVELDKPFWICYGIALAAIPIIALFCNWFKWHGYYHWYVKGDARVLEKGEVPAKKGSRGSGDGKSKVKIQSYQPPTPQDEDVARERRERQLRKQLEEEEEANPYVEVVKHATFDFEDDDEASISSNPYEDQRKRFRRRKGPARASRAKERQRKEESDDDDNDSSEYSSDGIV